jgi:hypothetical protein
MTKWRGRLIWLGILFLLWLLCSGLATREASGAPLARLTERLANYPNWQDKPPVQAAYGDLVYPDWFAGNWTVTTILTDMQAPLAPALVTPGFESNRQFLNQPIAFKVRFIQTKPNSLPDRLSFLLKLPLVKPASEIQLVSDRAYNGLQLAEAYLGESAVQDVKVDPENPNRQITLLKGGRQLVSTVVGRATESPQPDQFLTSELFRQEFRGAPQVYFNQVENTTAYTRIEDANATDQPAITADQVTAIFLSPQDPDYFKSLSSDNPLSAPRPVALYRYRMEFRRDS